MVPPCTAMYPVYTQKQSQSEPENKASEHAGVAQKPGGQR